MREPFGGGKGITGTVNAYEDEEHELIDRARAGEAIAFQRLAERHAPRLWRCALALGNDVHWAEDTTTGSFGVSLGIAVRN